MTLSRDFFDIGMHLRNGRYRVNLGGYASGWSPTFRFKSKAVAFYEAKKDSYPWASLEDWWFVDDGGQSIEIARCDNTEKFPAPPVLPNGGRLPGYCYDARPDLVAVAPTNCVTTAQLMWATPICMSIGCSTIGNVPVTQVSQERIEGE